MKTYSIGKLFLASAFILSATGSAFAQACDAYSYNIPNEGVTNCTGYFYDSGGPSSNYQNNETRGMEIYLPGSTITLKFSAFSTESGYDFLKIYDNLGATGTPIATLSGSSLPSPVISTTGEMSFRFTSDYSNVSSGWSAIWTSVGGDCGSAYNMPNVSVLGSKGTLYDSGGPTANYSNNESKTFNITPTDATTICLKFSAFNTEANYDKVKVWNNINGTGTLLGTFSGSSIPSDVTSSSGKMSVTFVSDGNTLGSGWAAIWTSDGTSRIPTGIDEQGVGEHRISLFPNPSNDNVTIGFTVKEAGQTRVAIYNLAGMETIVLDKMLNVGTQTIDFDVTSLASGIYFCKVITGSTVLVEKLIKN